LSGLKESKHPPEGADKTLTTELPLSRLLLQYRTNDDLRKWLINVPMTQKVNLKSH